MRKNTTVPRSRRWPHRAATVLTLITLLGVGSAAGPAVAAAPETPLTDGELLTLEQAVALAVEQNHQLAATRAQGDAASAGVEEAKAGKLPRIDLEAGYERSNNPTLVFSDKLGQEAFTAADFAVDSLNRPDDFDNWRTRLRVQQPLWTGGRLGLGQQIAESMARAADQGIAAARQGVVYKAIEGYTGVVVAQRQLTLTKEALATAEAHTKLVRDLYEGGLVVESDVLSAEVRTSEVQELVIRAESGVEIARAGLNAVLGRDLATPFAVADSLDDLASGPALDDTAAGDTALTDLVERALEQRPELAASHEQVMAAEARRRLEHAASRPMVALSGALEANAQDFFGTDGENYVVGVGLQWNIDGFVRRARTRRAAAETQVAEAADRQLADAIALDVRQAFSEKRAAAARLEQAGRAVGLAERSLTLVDDRYREGLTVVTELLDAETALTRARLRRLNSERDLLLADARLRLATGELGQGDF